MCAMYQNDNARTVVLSALYQAKKNEHIWHQLPLTSVVDEILFILLARNIYDVLWKRVMT